MRKDGEFYVENLIKNYLNAVRRRAVRIMLAAVCVSSPFCKYAGIYALGRGFLECGNMVLQLNTRLLYNQRGENAMLVL